MGEGLRDSLSGASKLGVSVGLSVGKTSTRDTHGGVLEREERGGGVMRDGMSADAGWMERKHSHSPLRHASTCGK